MTKPVLFDYWRSSAGYRVRIALALLGLDYERVVIDLLKGEHKDPANLARNPQGLVPTLKIDGQMLTQSLAIIEYLAELHPDAGLLPKAALDRHRVRALSYAVAMEIHPVCNLGVVGYAMQLGGEGEKTRTDWNNRFMGERLASLEAMLQQGSPSKFCFGDTPTMADTCLMPQLYNARRWGIDLSKMDRILTIEENCNQHPAFKAAHPDMFAPV